MSRHGGTPGTAHVDTTDASRRSDAASPHGRVVNGPDRSLRPHVFPLLFGLVDARLGGVDYLDTIGGDELMRLLRGWGAVHHSPVHRSDAHGENSQAGKRGLSSRTGVSSASRA